MASCRAHPCTAHTAFQMVAHLTQDILPKFCVVSIKPILLSEICDAELPLHCEVGQVKQANI